MTETVQQSDLWRAERALQDHRERLDPLGLLNDEDLSIVPAYRTQLDFVKSLRTLRHSQRSANTTHDPH